MASVRDEIAKNLLYYRKKFDFTQKELASKLGVKNSAVSNWENGLNSIDIDTLYKVCLVFDVTISDMYGAYANFPTMPFAHNYTQDEETLITLYRDLNPDGKEKLLDYADDLVSSSKYKKCSAPVVDAKKA